MSKASTLSSAIQTYEEDTRRVSRFQLYLTKLFNPVTSPLTLPSSLSGIHNWKTQRINFVHGSRALFCRYPTRHILFVSFRRPDRPIDQSFGRTFGSCLKHCRIPRAGHCPIQTDENQSPLVEQIVLFLDPRSKKFGAHISIGDSLKHIPSSQGRNGVRLDKHPRIHASGDKDLKVPGYLEHSES